MPLDFVSTHVYGNDQASDVFHTDEKITRDQMVCRAVKKVHEEIKSSSRPDMPLIWSEFNAAYDNEVAVTDSTYMGPWLATTIAQCDGLAEMMSLWTFSDVFEEQGVVKTPFYGGFGLIAAGNIPKPSFYAMQLLHRLGDQRIENSNANILVTKASDGSLVVAVWNLVNPGSTGEPKTVKLQFKGVRPNAKVSVWHVDDQHGNTLGAWEKMGSPQYPTQAQTEELREQVANRRSRERNPDRRHNNATALGERAGGAAGALGLGKLRLSSSAACKAAVILRHQRTA